ELVALGASGVFTGDALTELSDARGRLLLEAVGGGDPGGMAALSVGPEEAAALIHGCDSVVVANLNAPGQAVGSGTRGSVARVVQIARERGLRGEELPVACGFHSPIVSAAEEPLSAFVRRLCSGSPAVPVFSNLTADTYPGDPEAIARRVGAHAVRPVRFA